FLKQSVYWAYRLILGLVVVFGIAWVMAVVALHFFVLPKIDQYSEPILGSVSQAIGQTVEIGRIEAG
ncbi:MAG: hypothetical protein GTO41_18285, partial [Burkholderiales bacterium]|nr:hypothetical protein [Burkholderiales bacterium]